MNHLLTAPTAPRALYVCAHGAGAGMRHAFLELLARGLAARDVATFRYEFPYMEQRKHRVDPPAVAAARVREAVAEAARLVPGVPVFAGGKSFGGRMTSTAQATSPLEGVRGIVFLGFPLHPPARPGVERAEHLSRVEVPMLFLQGSRDEFAQLDLLRPVVAGLGARATLQQFEGGDHSFKAKGKTPDVVLTELCETIARWMEAVGRASLTPA